MNLKNKAAIVTGASSGIGEQTALGLAEEGAKVVLVGRNNEKYNDFLEHSRTTHPLGRVGRPEEIAKAIIFLASENSDWTMGLTMSIDVGGS